MIPRRHQAFIDNALAVLADDDRILGVGLCGSLKAGEGDEYSDIDLILLVAEESYEGILEERRDISSRLGDMVGCFTGEHVGAPELMICLYRRENLHVDLKFTPPSVLTAGRFENPKVLWERNGAMTSCLVGEPTGNPEPDLQWIEDRFWTWVHYMTAKLGRGELVESRGGLEFLRNLVLIPLLRRKAGVSQRGSRRFDMDLPEQMETLNRTYPAEMTKQAIGHALLSQVDLYRKLRDDLDEGSLIRGGAAEEHSFQWLEGILDT